MLALTACETKSDSQIQYRFADKAEGQELLMANTEYTIDPEECMADNFGFLLAYDEKGPEGKGYKTPEIIDGIRDYLKKE